VSRSQNVTFDPKKWTHPDSPGMYITYTYARVVSALKKTIVDLTYRRDDFTDGDIALLGMTSYLPYWLNRSYETMDFAGLANYAHDLARKLVNAYHAESIKDGRIGFKAAVFTALTCLGQTMNYLGMFPMEQV
jgi:arginyl-tRNA synthetase